MGLFAQNNLDEIILPDLGNVSIPERSELSIQSHHGWQLCAGGELTLFTDYDDNVVEWLHNGELLGVTATELTVQEGGIYQLQTTANDSLVFSEEIEVKIYESQVPVIVQDGHLLTASEAVSYQWFVNETPIESATEQTLYLIESGEYYVETTDENGCLATSKILSLTIANIHEVSLQAIDTYPSPTRDMLYVTPINIENQNFTLSIFDNNGKLVQQVSDRLRDNQPIELDMRSLPAGMYLLQFLGDKVQVMEKVSKM